MNVNKTFEYSMTVKQDGNAITGTRTIRDGNSKATMAIEGNVAGNCLDFHDTQLLAGNKNSWILVKGKLTAWIVGNRFVLAGPWQPINPGANAGSLELWKEDVAVARAAIDQNGKEKALLPKVQEPNVRIGQKEMLIGKEAKNDKQVAAGIEGVEKKNAVVRPERLAGRWNGTLTQGGGFVALLQFNLIQYGETVTGTAERRFGDAFAKLQLTGTVYEGALDFNETRFIQNKSSKKLQWATVRGKLKLATVGESTTLDGTWFATANPNISGRISWRRWNNSDMPAKVAKSRRTGGTAKHNSRAGS